MGMLMQRASRLGRGIGLWLWLPVLLALGPSAAWAQSAEKKPAAPAAAPSSGAQLTDEKLDQMTAPVALYPDALLAQVLMASTYPDQVMQAAKWSKEHPDAKGDEAVKQVESQPWDPSVQSLVAFPQALATFAQKPEWVRDLGNAFLAQPEAVMASVQRLRAMAKESGNLKSNEQQQVKEEEVAVEGQAEPQTVIKVEPTSPQVVYVPSYNPTAVYGAWPYPAYPPVYVPPPVGYGIAAGVATGIAFGVGVGVTNAIWGGFNWGHNDVDINVNRYNNINTNRQLNRNQSSWTRNNQNRIASARSNTRYNQTVNRGAARAGGAGREAQRTRAQQSVQRRQPGAYTGGARQRAEGAARTQGARPQGQRQAPQGQRQAPRAQGQRQAPQGRAGGAAQPQMRHQGAAPRPRPAPAAPRGGGHRGGGGRRR
jgi:hypothetical protein